MSDTPRTDTEEQWTCGCDQAFQAVHSSFARELERALTAAKARIAELERYTSGVRCPNCDHLRLELGELRTDAERYRWLRVERTDADLPTVQSTTVGCIGRDLTGEELDAAIDAARGVK